MPLKFKVYYACGIYMLLWGFGWLSFSVYTSISTPIEGAERAGLITVSIAFLLCIIKGVACLFMLKHLIHTTLPGKASRVFFIILFATNVLCTLVVALGVYLFIDIQLKPAETSSSATTLLDWSLFASIVIAGLAGIFMTLFDFALLKTIKQNYQDTLLSFEANVTEN